MEIAIKSRRVIRGDIVTPRYDPALSTLWYRPCYHRVPAVLTD